MSHIVNQKFALLITSFRCSFKLLITLNYFQMNWTAWICVWLHCTFSKSDSGILHFNQFFWLKSGYSCSFWGMSLCRISMRCLMCWSLVELKIKWQFVQMSVMHTDYANDFPHHWSASRADPVLPHPNLISSNYPRASMVNTTWPSDLLVMVSSLRCSTAKKLRLTYCQPNNWSAGSDLYPVLYLTLSS